MVHVTNKTQHSPRSFNVRRGAVGVGQQIVGPGETAELDIFDPENPVYAAWEEADEIAYDVGGKEKDEAAKRAGTPPNVPGPGAAPVVTPVPTMSANPASLTEAAGREPAEPQLREAAANEQPKRDVQPPLPARGPVLAAKDAPKPGEEKAGEQKKD